MLTIRLQRVGRKNQAAFRIVLAEKKRHVKKKAVEILGHYNPRTKEFGVKDEDRVKYWIGQHVEVSPTVHNLFVEKGILSGEKVSAWRPKIKKAKEDQSEGDAPKAPSNETAAKTETIEDAGETKEAEKREEALEDKQEVKAEDKSKVKPEPEKPKVEEPKAEVKELSPSADAQEDEKAEKAEVKTTEPKLGAKKEPEVTAPVSPNQGEEKGEVLSEETEAAPDTVDKKE